jgi:hypothetical protein
MGNFKKGMEDLRKQKINDLLEDHQPEKSLPPESTHPKEKPTEEKRPIGQPVCKEPNLPASTHHRVPPFSTTPP